MKKILTILILLSFCFIAKSQYVVPRGYPIKNMSYYNFAAPGGFVLIDSLIMTRSHDTTMKPLYPSLMYWQNTGVDSAWWQWDMVRWSKIGSGGGSGGVTTFFALTDVDSSGIQDGYIPYYDATSGNILFEAQGTSPIASGTTTYQVQDSTNTPPVSFPSGFDTTYWMVGGAGTGIFSGNNYKIALYINGVFDSFITPTVNDWAITLDDVIYHQYDGATWPRRTPPLWSTTLNLGGGFLGSSDNTNVFFRRRNINQIIFQNNGVRFPQLTGASDGLMGINTVGLSSNVQIGSGLLLSGGTLSSTVSGGITTADNGLTANTATNVRLGGAIVTNTTVSGAFTMSFTTDRVVINVGDSIQLAASNDIGITSLGTLRNTAATITSKAATATFGSNTKSIFHYETGVGDSIALELKSTGARWVGINTFSTSTTGYKPLQQDTVTGFMIRKLIDVSSSSQITGTLAVGNGGTGVATIASGGIMLGAGTSPITTLVGTVVNQVPVWNGTTWTTGTVTNYWNRQQYGALASTNILQQATLTDTIALFSGIAALRAKVNVGSNMNITGSLQVGANAAMNATYELDVTNDALIQDLLRVNGRSSFNTFADPVAGQAMTLGLSNASGGGGLFIGTNQITTNNPVYGIRVTPTLNQTSAAAGTGFTGVSILSTQSNSATPLSGYIIGVDNQFSVRSTNATEVPLVIGYKNSIDANGGTQKATTAYGFRDFGIVISSGSGEFVSGNYYGLKLDSSWTTRVGGTIYGVNQADNSALDIVNVFQSKSSFGTTTTPTAFVMIGAGTTANSQIKFTPGVAPTSPNDGDHWYEDTNDRLMFRQNATSVELLGTSAVNSVSPTSPNRTITVVINGTTYYIAAKTTND